MQTVALAVADLEVEATPEDLMLSYVSGEKGKVKIFPSNSSLWHILWSMCRSLYVRQKAKSFTVDKWFHLRNLFCIWQDLKIHCCSEIGCLKIGTSNLKNEKVAKLVLSFPDASLKANSVTEQVKTRQVQDTNPRCLSKLWFSQCREHACFQPHIIFFAFLHLQIYL